MQLNRVLVGIDFSAPSLAAARWAAEYFAPRAELILIHVIPEPRTPSYVVRRLARPDPAAAERTATLLRGLMALAGSMGGPRATADVRVGDPARQLARAATELGADVIVVARTGQRASNATSRRLGSTADRIVRIAPVPALVTARTPATGPRTIFTAIDDGEIGDSVLGWGVYLARKLHAHLTALHVVEYADPTGASLRPGGGRDAPAGDDAVRDAADAWLRAKVTAAGYSPSRAEIAIAVGDPRHELLAAAGCLDAGLIVIGRRGADGSERTGLGGLTRAALRPSTRPVLVVPPGESSPPLGGPFRGRRSRILRIADREATHNITLDVTSNPPAAHAG